MMMMMINGKANLAGGLFTRRQSRGRKAKRFALVMILFWSALRPSDTW